MPVPTHGDNCVTRIWPAPCPDCGASVYFLSCSCGSKVYLEDDEPPWVRHEDVCAGLVVEDLVQNEGMTAERMRRVVETEAWATGQPVPSHIWQLFNTVDGGRKHRGVEFDEATEPTEVEGIVRTINRLVNLFKRLNLVDSPMGRAVLDAFATQPYYEVVVREDPDDLRHIRLEYTFYFAAKAWEATRANVGARVYAALDIVALHTGRTLCVAKAIRSLR